MRRPSAKLHDEETRRREGDANILAVRGQISTLSRNRESVRSGRACAPQLTSLCNVYVLWSCINFAGAPKNVSRGGGGRRGEMCERKIDRPKRLQKSIEINL
ncbi:hypothetical protein [Aureimonas mangrovi]|uniref:hypothetical protein n=1 Tax=Aureimonas mangrovi TaxID=2758041 RepID=UPI00163DD085|nr:hypothetical protein [Aureimonas mangrovi]